MYILRNKDNKDHYYDNNGEIVINTMLAARFMDYETPDKFVKAHKITDYELVDYDPYYDKHLGRTQ